MNRPRVLFVDDDQYVLDGLAASLWRSEKVWDMTFVCGGRAAIAALDTTPFDAVVTDMRMPGIDGEAVLGAARERQPSALRLVLSGQTDAAALTRATVVAHQFLSKPCRHAELVACLTKLLDLVGHMPPPLRELVLGAGDLALCVFVRERLDALFASSNVALPTVLACIRDDVAASAKLMHVAGAGFFARRQPIVTLEQALDILGLATVRTFVLAMQTKALDCPAAGTGDLWDAVGQRILCERFGDAYAEVLARAAIDPTRPLAALELERFGMQHEAIGAGLAQLWGLR